VVDVIEAAGAEPEVVVKATHVGFRPVLRIPGAPRLVTGAVVGRMPIGMLSLAVLLLVHEQYGSFALAGLTVGAMAFGTVVAAPVQGALIDRIGVRRVLVPVALGQGTATAALAAAAVAGLPLVLVVLVALAVGVLTPPLSATLRMTWMHLIDDGPVRDAAFALDAMTTQLLFALAPLLTAAIIAIASAAATVVVSGLVTVAGTVIFAGSAPVVAAGRARVEGRDGGAPDVGRLRSMAATMSPGLRAVLATVLLVGWAGGSIEVGLPALAVERGSPAVSGVLVGLWCCGGVVGGWFYGRRSWKASIEARHQVAAAAAALLVLPLIAAHTIAVAVVLSFVAGLPWAALFACQYRMVAEQAPPRAMTEAFTWSISALIAGTAIGTSTGGAMASALGPSICFVQAAVVVGSLVVWDWLRGRR
jgi:MFS family permease